MMSANSGVARVCWCLGQWLPLTEIVNFKKKKLFVAVILNLVSAEN